MKKKLSAFFALLMILSIVFAGCSEGNEGMAGSAGLGEYEETAICEGELDAYFGNKKLGSFILSEQDDGWVFEVPNVHQYFGYSSGLKSCASMKTPFVWKYDGGLYFTDRGINMYLQSDGKTVKARAKANVTFKKLVDDPNKPLDTVATVSTPSGTEYYNTLSEAWDKVNENTTVPVTLTLYKNVYDEDVPEMLSAEARNSDAPLVIDMGGFTVNRIINTAKENGSVFYFDNPGDITIKNGEIKGGYTETYGGGLYLGSEGLKVTLEDLYIMDNHAIQGGGGIYLDKNTDSLTLKNVHIQDNEAYEDGGSGINWHRDGSDCADLILSGSVVITGNGTDFVKNDNLKFSGDLGDRKLNVSSLGEGSNIGVRYNELNEGIFTEKVNNAETLKNYFSADDSLQTIIVKDGCLALGVDTQQVKAGIYYAGYWRYTTSFQEAWGWANTKTDEDITMKLFADWNAVNGGFDEGATYCYKDGALEPKERDNDDSWLIMDLNGHAINRELYDPDKGINTPRGNGCVFYIGTGSEDVNIKIMNGTITGGNNTGDGGAIYCNGNSRSCASNVILENLVIEKNRCNGKGGGIGHTEIDGTYFSIKDSKIINNQSNGEGGGANINGCHLKGTVIIFDNMGPEGAHDLYLSTNISTVDGMELDYNTSKISVNKPYKIQDNSHYRLVRVASNLDDSTLMKPFYSSRSLSVETIGDVSYIRFAY